VVIEENKSMDGATKDDNDFMATIEEKFEVIREDLKDSFYSPRLETNNYNQRDNSDFKKFTGEDDNSTMLESKWLTKLGGSNPGVTHTFSQQ